LLKLALVALVVVVATVFDVFDVVVVVAGVHVSVTMAIDCALTEKTQRNHHRQS